MKKVFCVFLCVCFFVNTAYGTTKAPEVEAKGAILIEEKTGRVLWEKEAYTEMAMASTTKIMTAIIALENGNLNDIVKVSRRAAISPKVKMNLSAGEQIKMEYLLYALMLQSYNDAAVAIATRIKQMTTNVSIDEIKNGDILPLNAIPT